jgi:MSHA pilin protein MshC
MHPVRCAAQRKSERGFTLPELVTVMVIVGVLSVVAIPKVFDRSIFEARGFADELRSAIQFARKTAIAQRRNVCVAIDTSTSTVALTKALTPGSTAPCGPAVTNPAKNSGFQLTAPGDVTLSSTTSSITFDALGATGAGGTVTVISADASRPIVVESETGYVH